MTAREELLQLIDDLTEEEAAACVKAIEGKRELKKKWHDPREDEWPLKPKVPPEEVAEFFRSWAKNGPTLTEEEWEDLRLLLQFATPGPLFS